MKLELTQKDIFLLKLALSVLIVFLSFRFLIMPGVAQYQEKILEAETLAETREEMKAAMESVPFLEQSIETRRQQLAEASAPYYMHMENSQVDEILTGLALKLGLFPVSLAIQNAQPGIPEPYLYAKSTTSEAAFDDAGAGSETASGDNDAGSEAESAAALGESAPQESPAYLLIGTGSFILRGSQEQMFSFIDELEQNYPGIHIRSMQINQRAFLDSAWEVIEELEAAFELDIYMYKTSPLWR